MSNSIDRHRVANSNLLQYASKNRDEGFFNDLTIIAENENISANRLVLSCYSKYLEGMFKKSILRHDNTIEIRAVGGATLKALIDFIYCGSININNQNVMNLLSGAEYLQLEEVKCFCFEFLEANEIVLDNALDIFKMISKHKESTLLEKLKKYISMNFNKVSKTEKFKLLSKVDLISCISILDRLHANEASIYQAVVTWTRHNEEARKTEFSELFNMINLNQMAVDFLEKIIQEENLNPKCRKQTFEVYKQLNSEQKETHLISLGGDFTRQNVTMALSLSQETSKAYPKLDEKISIQCSLKLNDYIYIIGKQLQTTSSSSNSNGVVFKLNLKQQDGKWKQVASPSKCRILIAASVFYGTLFVAGGFHEGSETALSEYYDPAINEWNSGPQLNQNRSSHCLVSCHGCLYALGGYNGIERLSSVEMLDDLKGAWQNIHPMQAQRVAFAAVNCNGEVYAIGGCGNTFLSGRLKTVEKYDRVANRWTYVNDMNIARAKHAACVLSGKIYVVGGRSIDGKIVKEIECYDPAADQWSIVGTVANDLVDHNLVAV